MKLVHWPLMDGLLHLVQRGGDWAGPFLAVPNVIAHPSTASVAITVLLYNGPLLCGLNVLIKWLIRVYIYSLMSWLENVCCIWRCNDDDDDDDVDVRQSKWRCLLYIRLSTHLSTRRLRLSAGDELSDYFALWISFDYHCFYSVLSARKM